MKGIILAGGSGTRLFPLTKTTSKQLLPVYDKPMIYYPLSILMLANIKDVLVITSPRDSASFFNLLGDGSQWGINIQYATQEAPNGLAEAFLIGEDFVGDDDVCLILGDNILYGSDFSSILSSAIKENQGATVFTYPVKNPKEFGVAELDENRNVLSIEEKPKNPKSNNAVVGLYFYDNSVIQKAKSIKPSARGELEITDINKLYLQEKKLKARILGRGFAWLDAGTIEDLLDASNFIYTIEKRQGYKIACLEEIALRKGYINKDQIQKISKNMKNSAYSRYLEGLIQ